MTEQDDSFHKEPANKHECSGRLTGAGIHPVLCLVLGNQLSHANADFNDAYAKGNDQLGFLIDEEGECVCFLLSTDALLEMRIHVTQTKLHALQRKYSLNIVCTFLVKKVIAVIQNILKL